MNWQTHYDRWATGGRYSKRTIGVLCPECEEWTTVTAEDEYGTTTWTPDECSSCRAPFPDNARVEEEPDEPDHDPWREEEDRD